MTRKIVNILFLLLGCLEIEYVQAKENGFVIEKECLTILSQSGFEEWGKRDGEQRRSIKEIIISEGIENIPPLSFQKMYELKKISLPSSLKIIGIGAFFSCKNLSTVLFSDHSSLTFIGAHAFRRTNLDYIVIPKTVTIIGKSAFRGCRNLHSINFSSTERLTRIGDWAFAQSGLTHINLPKSLKYLGKATFYGCTKMTEVSFTPYVDIETIEPGTFSYSGITSIQIPESVESIRDRAFYCCKSLARIEFVGGKLEIIGRFAFAHTKLNTIQIPASVEYIGEVAFSDCYKLSFVEFEQGSKIRTLEKAVFYGSNIFSIKLPTLLERIKAGAFSNTKIMKIEIPNTVIYLDENAFYNCRNLLEVSFNSTIAPILGKNVFTYCLALQIIRIPVVQVGYLDGNWKQYKSRIKKCL